MTYSEWKQNLFYVPQGFYLVHCISGDYALGAGIAKKFDALYNMRFKLHRDYPIPKDQLYANVGKALLIDNVFNLVTKKRYYQKPTYDSVYETLIDLKRQCDCKNISKIAMPLIGCGLDRLNWDIVKEMVKGVFEDTNVEIVVCKI